MNIRRENIAILGLGRTGQSLARFLLRQGHNCFGYDEQKVKLPDDLELPVKTGPFTYDRLKEYDRVIVSPGIRWSHPALVELRQAGKTVIGDLDLFLEHYQGHLIAVTGTNGKTTTTFLIETMLETLAGGIEAGGNIGIPMLDLVTDGRNPPRVVLELSSFQLERTADIRPQWAVLLNVQEDHADAHGSHAEYVAAKLGLFARQGDGDTALIPIGEEWESLIAEMRSRGAGIHRFGYCNEHDAAPDGLACGVMTTSNGPMIFWYQDNQRQFIHCDQIPARGRHQHMNMAVAAQAAADHGVSLEVIRETMTSFRGLKHRLEHIDLKGGHDWYDDSKATNPEAAIAALNSFDRSIWICGGLSKELDLTPLIPVVKQRVSRAFVIGKQPAPYSEMLERSGVPYEVSGTVDKAVAAAAGIKDNEPILLSPAAASQDQFSDYAERGKAFAEAVLQLDGGGK